MDVLNIKMHIQSFLHENKAARDLKNDDKMASSCQRVDTFKMLKYNIVLIYFTLF